MKYIKESEAKKMINESDVIIELEGEEKGFKIQRLLSYKDGSSWLDDIIEFIVCVDSEGDKSLSIRDGSYNNWNDVQPKYFDILRKVMDMVEDKDA